MSISDLKLRLHDVPGIEQLTMKMLAGRQVYSFAGRVVALGAGASDGEVITAIRAAVSSDAIAQIPAGTPAASTATVPMDVANVSAAPTAGEASPVSGTSPATITSQSGTATADVTAPSPSSALATNTMPVEREGQPVTSIEDNTTAARSASSALIPPVHAVAPSQQPSGTKASPMNTGAAHASLSLKQMVEQQKARIQQAIADNMAHLQAGFDRQAQVAASIGTIGDRVHADADDLAATLGQLTNDITGTASA